jgi:hypothetical protein
VARHAGFFDLPLRRARPFLDWILQTPDAREAAGIAREMKRASPPTWPD